jgi:hypothetical protein
MPSPSTGVFPSPLCPKCKRGIYDRRKKLCDFCGTELSSGLLFTSAQIATMDQIAADAKMGGWVAQYQRSHALAYTSETSYCPASFLSL